MHDNTIHKVNADWCGCSQRKPFRIQMIRSEVYPSTTIFPKTGATFRMLEGYEMFSASGKLSIFEFYQSLEKLTDNTRVKIPKVRLFFSIWA